MPQFQPDGQRSVARAKALGKSNLLGKRTSFEWFYLNFEKEVFPTEISLTQLVYKGQIYVVVFIYDLRHTKKMEQSIIQLESEVSKIFYDPLTGIYNRRFFDENLKRVIKNLSRSEGTLSMMMVDIDYFKNYDDTYGHIEGDNCLKIIAETLVNSVTREGDFVARYGGEEFVIVMPNTTEQGACLIAEKLLENVRRHNIPHSNSEVADHITISIGVISGKVQYTNTVNDYIKHADEVMYRSKQAGRDRYIYEPA